MSFLFLDTHLPYLVNVMVADTEELASGFREDCRVARQLLKKAVPKRIPGVQISDATLKTNDFLVQNLDK